MSLTPLLLLALLLGGRGPFQEPVAPIPTLEADARVLQPEVLEGLFGQGEERVPVIITMQIPAARVGFSRWAEPGPAQQHRERTAAQLDAFLARLETGDLVPRFRLENLPIVAGSVTRDGLARVLALPDVEFVEYDQPTYMHTEEGIALMNGLEVRSQFDGTGLSIAIVDSGLDYFSLALGAGPIPNGRVIGGYDFGDDDGDPMDLLGHGTSVAGIAAGSPVPALNFFGGVAPGASIYALKVNQGSESIASTSAVIAAWDWCVTHQWDAPQQPIRVINTSLGSGQFPVECDAQNLSYGLAAAICASAGIAVIVSSGNDGFCSALSTPACLVNTISVGAVWDTSGGSAGFCVSANSCVSNTSSSCIDSTGFSCTSTVLVDRPICYSNSASFLELLAPAHFARTASLGGGFTDVFGGTSAAAPYAAGAALLLIDAASSMGLPLTVEDIRQVLFRSGEVKLDPKSGVTTPRVDLGAAVSFLEVVWVDFSHIGPQLGTYSQPFSTLAQGVNAAPSGGTVMLRAGSTVESQLIVKNVTLLAEDGTVVVR